MSAVAVFTLLALVYTDFAIAKPYPGLLAKELSEM